MKFSGVKERAEGQVRLLRARALVELGKVASGSAAQGHWLIDGKVGPQVSGEDRNLLLGRGTVGEVGREDENRSQ